MKYMKLIGLAALMVVVAVTATGCTNYKKTKDGTVGVVVGDNVRAANIKDVLCPGAGAKDVGLDVKVRKYPSSSSARYYDPKHDSPDSPVFVAETADGVALRIKGELGFNTNFGCKGDQRKTLETFHRQYGTRKFPIPGAGGGDSGPSAYPWDGAGGWGGYLEINHRPVMDKVLNDLVGLQSCEALKPACAAARGGEIGATLADVEQGKESVETRRALEKAVVDAINDGLREKWAFTDDKGKRHEPVYMTYSDFRITAIELPDQMQAAIDSAQASYASLSENRANLQKAKIDAETKRIQSQQFAQSPAAKEVEIARILAGGNCTSGCVYGGGANVMLGGR